MLYATETRISSGCIGYLTCTQALPFHSSVHYYNIRNFISVSISRVWSIAVVNKVQKPQNLKVYSALAIVFINNGVLITKLLDQYDFRFH